MTMHTSRRPQRIDIQVLRGLAIVLVLLQHARITQVPGGFLGVDIFFVISGFLMAGLIDDGLEHGRFSFAGFYARRARRLLPAAYATLIVTALFAPFLLDASEYHYFVAQLAGSFGFFVNFVLLKQSDYFSTGAELKPLLHMWSLSVEEQFYILLPIGMLLATRRFRLAAIVAMIAVSGALCVWAVMKSPAAAFYMLPTRAWELGIGAAVALLVRRGALRARPMPAVRLLCAAVLLIVPVVADAGGHPGVPAALCCLATGVLLVPGATVGPGPIVTPMAWIGDRSYSLYLVHWPIYSFVNNVFIDPVPQPLNLALLLVCIAWAQLQYHFIEQPGRKMVLTPKALAILTGLPVILIGASLLWSRQAHGRMAARIPNHGLSSQCTYSGTYQPRAACVNSANPEMLVWGDSFAMHIVPGLAASEPAGLAQATRFVCGPFVGIAPMDRANFPAPWARSCIAFNDSVLAALRDMPSVHYVVLSSSLLQYLPRGERHDWRLMVRGHDGFENRPRDLASLTQSLQLTVESLHAIGKKVVLFAPPPESGMDTARCLERRRDKLPIVDGSGQCTFSNAEYHAERSVLLNFLGSLRGVVPVISLDQRLCGTGTCLSQVGSTPVYQDRAHLSIAGSRQLGTEMNWAALVRSNAR